MKRAQRRIVKKREPLAMLPEALHAGPEAIWWDFWTPIPQNERCGDVAVVHVRGSLDHHTGYGCDSYEAITARVRRALSGEDVVARAEIAALYDDSVEVPQATPPKAVVLRIDSPGGVVSGLNQTVFALRRMATEAGIELVAYVDELAASAAYALACACDRIVMPPSAIAGSIGVISTMFDQVEADKRMGVRFVTLTSGARKDDGHPHVPISDAAISAEQRRVDRLAVQFFQLVSDARPLSKSKIASYQAGIFLGQEAVDAQLADAISSWDDLIAELNEKNLDDPSNANSALTPSNVAARDERGPNMSLHALKALVVRTEKALAGEKDAARRKVLTRSLTAYKAAVEAYKKEKHTIEKHESEEGEEEGEEESESESSEGKGNETDRKEEGDGDDDEDDGDEDEGEESAESEEEEAAARTPSRELAALVHQITGKKGRAAVGALAAKIAAGERALAMVETIEKERRAEKKAAMIADAQRARRITPHEAKSLRGKPLSFVRSFLEMRPRAIINTDEDSPGAPEGGGTGAAGLPASVEAEIDRALSQSPDGVDRAKLRTSMIEAHKKRMAAGANGAGRF